MNIPQLLLVSMMGLDVASAAPLFAQDSPAPAGARRGETVLFGPVAFLFDIDWQPNF